MTPDVQAFSFISPTHIRFGSGTVSELPARLGEVGGTKPLLVGDPGMAANGLLGRVEGVLRAAGLAPVLFSAVESDPDVASVREGTRIAAEAGCDSVVALGGGSAMDAAKAIAMMMTNPGTPRDYAGTNRLKAPPLPIIAIPTTAGTGSELTIWSVLSDRATGDKFGIGSPMLCPRFAILDPELTLSLPAGLTATTGMDALTHAIESLVCTASNPFSAAHAEMAIRMIGENLRTAVAQGGNLAARSNMLVASALAGAAFNNTRLGYVHALSLPLGSKFKIPHGMVNAITLPAVMDFNLPGNLPAYARIATLLGERTGGLSLRDAARSSVEAVIALKQDIGLHQTLADFGLTEDRFDEVIDEAMTSGNCQVNPRQATKAEMRAILRAASG